MVTRFPALGVFLNDPRKLLVVAALWVALGVVMGYVAIQDRADRTLALRQGPPAPVALQHFDAKRHVGPAQEVVVRAEADLDQPLVLRLRGSDREILAFPLHRLSDLGEAAILAAQGRETASLGAQVARRTDVPGTRPKALGVLIFDLDGRDPEAIDLRSHVDAFGKGRFGTVIEINGAAQDPGGFALMIDGALSVSNMELAEPFLTVHPFEQGREAFMRHAAPVTEKGRYFFWTALGVTLLALLLSLSGFGPKDERARIYESERAQGRKWSKGPRSSAHFDPLASQEEVTAEDIAENAPEPSRVGLAFRLLVREIVAAVRRVRSPR